MKNFDQLNRDCAEGSSLEPLRVPSRDEARTLRILIDKATGDLDPIEEGEEFLDYTEEVGHLARLNDWLHGRRAARDLKKRTWYSHQVTVCFSIEAQEEHPEDLDQDLILNAARERLDGLERDWDSDSFEAFCFEESSSYTKED